MAGWRLWLLAAGEAPDASARPVVNIVTITTYTYISSVICDINESIARVSCGLGRDVLLVSREGSSRRASPAPLVSSTWPLYTEISTV